MPNSSEIQLHNKDEPTKPLSLVHFNNCTQLKDTNTYRQWRFQIQSMLNGFGLFDFLDGTNMPPPKEIVSTPTPPDTKSVTTPNPAYTTWYRQDQLILGALAGTLSPSVASLIVHVQTSHEAWTTLLRTYANPSRGHILQIKDRLDTISHSDTSITEYMQAIKACTDDLAQLGKPMDHEDIISKVIKGLDYGLYKPVIDAVRGRDTPISFESLHEKLIHHELTVKNNPPVSSFPPSAHAAHSRSAPLRSTYPQRHTPYMPKHSSTDGSHSEPKFKGRCQYCDIVGHVVSYCRKFKALYPNVSFPTRQSAARSSRPHAHTATHSDSPNPNNWLLDSGASHHITDDLDLLSYHSPYDGPDDLLIGDGSSLTITHTGSFSISNLQFNNVLCVPNISRKLLSVSQFCLDNNAIAIFSSTSFCIKALKTGAVLL
ncbi:hypothetical protein vseg_005982 [Gypsophila vaccaria]